MRRLHLNDAERSALRHAGYSRQRVYSWTSGKALPNKTELPRLEKLLTRDLYAELNMPRPAQKEKTMFFPDPCAHDDACIQHRRRELAAERNLAADQWKRSPCQNCKPGIERERALAATRKIAAGDYCRTEECTERIGHSNATGYCWRCTYKKRNRKYAPAGQASQNWASYRA